jgi:glycerol-1-phosphate dehydrogenase [NAD(P)+]
VTIEIKLPDGPERCACGMTHLVPIEEVVVDPQAFEQLAAYCLGKAWRRVMLVMDANTVEAAGTRLRGHLEDAGLTVAALRFPRRSGLKADEGGVALVRARLRSDPPDGLISVGSGVLTDLTRYGGHLEGHDFVSVPTAASMDGYASSVAAMEFNGVKVTHPARPPLAIFADPGVIATAPAELTRSGLGDMLGKATARTDWLASHLLYEEHFCASVDARVHEPLVRTLESIDAVLDGEAAAIEALLAGLIESGVAMAMVGSSRPASGCEHHASHFWDLLAARGVREHHSHGLQVGYATLFAISLQRFAFAGGVAELAPAGEPVPLDAEAREWLGGPPPEVLAAIEEKRSYENERSDRWPAGADWTALRARLAPALELFPKVEQALSRAGITADPGFLELDATTLRATFRYASHLRARYTTIDFLAGQGELEEALERMLAATSDRARGSG